MRQSQFSMKIQGQFEAEINSRRSSLASKLDRYAGIATASGFLE
jgi:hypothetical protein